MPKKTSNNQRTHSNVQPVIGLAGVDVQLGHIAVGFLFGI